jgi:hypothetical protein
MSWWHQESLSHVGTSQLMNKFTFNANWAVSISDYTWICRLIIWRSRVISDMRSSDDCAHGDWRCLSIFFAVHADVNLSVTRKLMASWFHDSQQVDDFDAQQKFLNLSSYRDFFLFMTVFIVSSALWADELKETQLWRSVLITTLNPPGIRKCFTRVIWMFVVKLIKPKTRTKTEKITARAMT